MSTHPNDDTGVERISFGGHTPAQLRAVIEGGPRYTREEALRIVADFVARWRRAERDRLVFGEGVVEHGAPPRSGYAMMMTAGNRPVDWLRELVAEHRAELDEGALDTRIVWHDEPVVDGEVDPFLRLRALGEIRSDRPVTVMHPKQLEAFRAWAREESSATAALTWSTGRRTRRARERWEADAAELVRRGLAERVPEPKRREVVPYVIVLVVLVALQGWT